MSSIADLKLAPVPQMEEEEYEAPSQSQGLPDDGEYLLRLQEQFPDDAVSADKRKDEDFGFLRLRLDPVIVEMADGEDTPHKGHTLRYQEASVRTFGWRKASQMTDLLASLGLNPSELPSDPNAALEYLRNELPSGEFRAYCRWERSVKNKDGSWLNLRGQEAFMPAALRKAGFEIPKEAEGPQRAFPSNWEKDEKTGEKKVLFANLRVARYLMQGV